MKKTTLSILGLFINYLSYSQNQKILVEYQAQKGHITNTETLVALNESAIYVTDSLLIENNQNAKIIEEDEYNNKITISQKTIKLDATKYYLENSENIIFFTQNYQGNAVVVKDSLPNYSWDISSKEIKKIGDFLCKKATTVFRGSEIIAWYAEDLNIPFGPWKFKGLPGLILELYNINDTTKHIWKAKKIKFPYTQDTDFEKNDLLPIISFEQVIIDMENEIKEQMMRMQSRVPQGVSVSNTKLNRTGLEKEFEWEK
ncbi:GLPGLI family protein [Mesonia sp. HuA40]|uniref:GLPGLI family protein n=1 Tax=Mesonia sp. HuA40 TaxID=2602761 RepID=UPI0011CC4F83|nr:GLPGLI family protein [Mesonia sp. HuA40]TXK71948.1 GLPGLI family protein [Mesonia sp. HuA40]